ncbi:hypothetical protein P3T76_007386 [Phytophthora citrophthora]|uniref:Uncharacterized protein n=1 Tax=Phytophthora citrophthora TaxID=4793 RepID=A0AAD9GN64_9STRA|nr:hypothetical protein P3T76_007386 [Phytophthora citrophthora]
MNTTTEADGYLLNNTNDYSTASGSWKTLSKEKACKRFSVREGSERLGDMTSEACSDEVASGDVQPAGWLGVPRSRLATSRGLAVRGPEAGMWRASSGLDGDHNEVSL